MINFLYKDWFYTFYKWSSKIADFDASVLEIQELLSKYLIKLKFYVWNILDWASLIEACEIPINKCMAIWLN